ncbi:EAL domain-containing protein [Treponema sp. JC4]|uniref:EAL domain-containing protein n=1 Tax=Treponema sp. JC4 TaxID=1124982 RepID=UPI00025B0292|nr:EAL domain-containing protein [Treponema sp. JC4]EID86336.1 EAL domain-containing protein [Treponema sp. JC4]
MGNKLNPKVIKYIFTAVLSAVASILIVLVTSTFSKKIMSFYRRNSFETTKLIADGYAELANERLNTYFGALDSLYDEEIFSKGTTLDIIYHINKNKSKIPPEFLDVFYFDFEGVATDIHGNTQYVTDRAYYNAIVYSGSKSFITAAQSSKVDGKYIFMMVKAVYDKNARLKGGYGCAVDLYQFEEIFQNANIIQKGSISIIDKYGKFIIHKNHEMISHSYPQDDKRYIRIATTTLAKNKSGIESFRDENGIPVTIFYSYIKSPGWVLCFTLPDENMLVIERKRLLINIITILCCVILLFTLFFGEFMTIELFQRKSLIFVDFDPLTGLWSLDRFEHEADKMIARHKKAKFFLLDIDILGYKFISQNHGDAELKKILKFLSREVKKVADENQGVCCRGDSDHFFIFFKITSVQQAMRVFKMIARKEYNITDSYKIPFALKFGLAFHLPEEKYKGISTHVLINQASIAKKNLHKEGDLLYAIYDSKFLKRIQTEYFLESQSEKALANHEFFVLYQPKISLKNEKIIGAEALVRWQHPERGVIPPNDFIPLFERTGFVTKVDFFVYEEVLKFLDARLRAGHPVVQVSVNMSRNHNKPEKFMEDFLAVFNKYNVPAKYIQVEIIERSFAENRILAEITTRLHQNGFTVAMDDFGTGESSLSMLTQVPIDVLKFDRSFLLSSTNANGEIDRRSAAFIESFIGLSKRLDKETVFEGVETESQRDFLRVIDCDCVQGYLYSRPLSQVDFEKFIETHI